MLATTRSLIAELGNCIGIIKTRTTIKYKYNLQNIRKESIELDNQMRNIVLIRHTVKRKY